MPKISKSARAIEAQRAPQIVGSSFDEHALVRKMADNSRPVREKALKALAQYLATPQTLDELKLKKLCKGIFYAMWYCDRPITQQNLANEIAALSEKVKPKNYWRFVSSFWAVLIREWHSIDSHRTNKFYLLIRRFYFALLSHLYESKWSPVELGVYLDTMTAGPLNADDPKVPHAIRLHLCDIYLDEIERLREKADEIPFSELLSPIEALAERSNFKIIKQRAKETLSDPRLYQWGVKEIEEEPSLSEEELDDWEGFD